MYRLAHLSDLHFGKLDERIAEALLRDLQALAPSLVVVSGDLVQRPSRRSLAEAAAYLERLPQPVLTIAGNHDLPVFNLVRRVFDPFGRFRRYIADDLAPTHVSEDVAVLGLSSAKALVFDFAQGRVDAAQRATLEAFFATQPPQRVRIVAVHHPVRPPPDRPRTPLVYGAAKLAESLRHCRVDLVLSGHLHRSFVRGLEGRLGPSQPASGRAEAGPQRTLLCHAGTATSVRLRAEPQSYAILELTQTDGLWSLTLRYRMWAGDGFIDRERLQLARRADGWTPVPQPGLST